MIKKIIGTGFKGKNYNEKLIENYYLPIALSIILLMECNITPVKEIKVPANVKSAASIVGARD